MGNTTNIPRKILLLRLAMLGLLAILSHRVILVFLTSRQILGNNGSVASVGLKPLFLPFVCVLFFGILRDVLKLEYMMLVSGLLLVYLPLYYSFALSSLILEIIQTIGLILYLIAVIRIAVFLIRPKSDKFIEALLKKSRR